MLARMSRKALALLMVFCMVVSALSISALAVDLNPTEFHIMTLQSIKDKVAEIEGVSSDSVKICTIDVHGYRKLADETGTAGGGAATHYLVIDDLGYQGLNGRAEYGGTAYWKVLNDAVILDVNKGITGLTVYSRINGTETATVISETYLNTVELDGKLITEIYLDDPNKPAPEEGESVYVYLKAVDGLGEDNGRGYITVGEIKMNLPAANAEYRTGGEARYAEYTDEISAALANIARYNNNTIDLSDVAWYTLHCASGADGYVENQETWHLDGKIRVYNVNYHHNNGTEVVTTDPNGYMAGESFAPMTIEDLTYEGHTFLGWSTDPKAATPAASFSIPVDGGDVDLYAVWKFDEPVAETHDAWFFVRTDGVVPIETGSTQYDSSYYKPTHADDGAGALTGKVDGTAAWTNYYGTIENGAINGVKLSEAFAKVAEHIDTAPTNDAIKAALGEDFDPATQGVVWYVVKEMDNGTDYTGQCPGWHVDGIVYTKGEDITEVRILNYYRNVEANESPIAFSVHGKDTVAKVSAGITPTRENYEFTGWNTAADGSGTPYKAGDPIAMTEDVNLYAQWKLKDTDPDPATYNVTYVYAGSVPSGYTAPKDETAYKAGDTVTVSADPTTIPTNYTFSGWTVTEPSGITITDDGKFTMPEGNVTLTGTWTYTDPGSNPGPSYDYYRVTVNYLDRADGSKIAGSYVSPSHIEGSRYDVSEYDAIAIEGYTYDATEGDAVSGILNGNKTVNVYYMADETDIDDGDTPTTDLPDVPGEGDGGETDIGDGQTPTTDLPDTGDNGGETDIPDTGTPTGSLPQTGTLAQTSAVRLALGALALTASVAAAGLALLLFRKSRKA